MEALESAFARFGGVSVSRSSVCMSSGFLERAENVNLLGPPGVGKSSLGDQPGDRSGRSRPTVIVRSGRGNLRPAGEAVARSRPVYCYSRSSLRPSIQASPAWANDYGRRVYYGTLAGLPDDRHAL